MPGVVILPILQQLTIHRTHRPIDRIVVSIRAKHRANKHAPSPSKAGTSAEANLGDASQSQRALAAPPGGQVRIGVASEVAARGRHVGGISRDVNRDLDVPAVYVPGKGVTTCSTRRPRYFMLRSRRIVVAAGDRDAEPGYLFRDESANSSSATTFARERSPDTAHRNQPPPHNPCEPMACHRGRRDRVTPDRRRAPTPDNRRVRPGIADAERCAGRRRNQL
jgi:hypothetical protein